MPTAFTPNPNRLHGLLRGLTILALLVAAACAKPKADDPSIDKSLTPARVLADIAAARGHKVRWGGVIVSSTNLKEASQLEILAYPLDDDGRPERDDAPLGRFIAMKPGYLETVDYAPGRLVTVVGPVQEIRTQKLGEADYRYPVIAADEVKLWQIRAPRNEPRFHFGIGVGVGL